jgi:hypothetical protein
LIYSILIFNIVKNIRAERYLSLCLDTVKIDTVAKTILKEYSGKLDNGYAQKYLFLGQSVRIY